MYMNKIANIVLLDNILNKVDIINDLLDNNSHKYINIVNCNDIINKSIPTLYIGYIVYKKNINSDINILDKQINDITFWTFSKSEKIVDYYNDLRYFESNILNYYSYIYNYKPFNFLLYDNNKNFNDLNRLFNTPIIDTIKMVYINNRSVYILFNNKNDIIGLDLMYFWYIDKIKTISLIKSILRLKNYNKLVFDKKGKILSQYVNENKIMFDRYLIERYLCLFM